MSEEKKALNVHLVQYGTLSPAALLSIARKFKGYQLYRASQTFCMALIPERKKKGLKSLPIDLTGLPTAIRGVKVNPSMYVNYGLCLSSDKQKWLPCSKAGDFKGGHAHLVVDPEISTEVQEQLWTAIKKKQME